MGTNAISTGSVDLRLGRARAPDVVDLVESGQDEVGATHRTMDTPSGARQRLSIPGLHFLSRDRIQGGGSS